MPSHIRWLTAALAGGFLVLHLLSLTRSLEDIDTINFALGVESFDVAEHQPHPPGYPVFIAMGKVSTAIVNLLADDWDRTRRAAVGLALWGIVSGTVFAWVLVGFWRASGWSPLEAWMAAALAVVSPLFWFTAARPLTDAVALVAATAVQWLLVREAMAGGVAVSARRFYIAAFAAGLLIGLRTQTMWLTLPLVVWVAARLMWQGRQRETMIAVAAGAAGCLLWAVPLLVASGGLGAYLTALADQGGEDFSNIRMLATSTDSALLAESFRATFLRPWRVAWLGQLVAGLALVGLVRVAVRRPPSGLPLLLAFVPSLVFHLAFHEVDHVRYALPVVVPMAGLAVYGLLVVRHRAVTAFGVLVLLASAVVAQESLGAYGRYVPATFAAFGDAERDARLQPVEPVVVTHLGMRRVADWFRREWPTLPRLTTAEPAWLWVVEHFRSGNTAPVWWLADLRLTDMVLFDRRARRVEREYLHDREVRRLVGQTRQDEVRWWSLGRPNWMLGRGWALSTLVGGVTFSTGRDPRQVPAEAYVRRMDVPTRIMIGGRHLSGSRPAVIVTEIDGRPVSRWPVESGQPSFLYFIDLPAQALAADDGAYAEVRVRIEMDEPTNPDGRIALDQFDFAPATDVVGGFAAGWHATETDTTTGRSWRWAGRQATMLAVAGEGPVRLMLDGESSAAYFERPSVVVVSVEGREVARITADRDFQAAIDLPADVWTGPPVRVSIAPDQVYVPAERGESVDRRDLGLRFFRAEFVRP